MKPQDYDVNVRPLSEEDGGGFLAIVPSLAGCMSDGESAAEALENAYEAIACWIETAIAEGRSVPVPRIFA